ncbi:MAG: FtsW/RodA/SpoVE family cell cycle protein [Vulcanimicrobiota bacterium]
MNRVFPQYKYNSFPLISKARIQERKLMAWITIIMALGVFMLTRTGIEFFLSPIMGGSILLVSFWGLHLFMVLRKQKGDELFLPLTFFLISMGWLEIFRIDPQFAMRQLIWILIGEVVFILWLVFLKDYQVLEDYKYIFLVLAVVLQTLVALFGLEVNGAKLWFDLGFFSIQPVEFIKIFLTVFLVSYLKQNRNLLEKDAQNTSKWISMKYYVLLFTLWAIAESVLVIQKDLGMAFLLFGVFVGLFYVVTRKAYLTFSALLLFVLSGYILYEIFPHVRIRIDNWWNPWSDPEGTGYQMIQSLFSMGNGGILGAGLGRGEPFYIPAVHTDFIFVAIAEEFGLVGAIVTLGIFLVLIQRMFRTALETRDEFGKLLALGLGVLIATQVFIIVAGAVKFIPLTGITLPFVSYGGSSMVSNFIILAIYMQISGTIESSFKEKNHGQN